MCYYRLSAQTVNTTVNIIGPSTELHLSVGGTNIREYIYQNHLSRITKPVAINSVSCVVFLLYIRALRYCQKLYFGILLKQYFGITKY